MVYKHNPSNIRYIVDTTESPYPLLEVFDDYEDAVIFRDKLLTDPRVADYVKLTKGEVDPCTHRIHDLED